MVAAFFIDKDGTLVDNSQYPEVIPTNELLVNDVLDGLKHIKEKGYKIIIVSNQPWVGRGRMMSVEVEGVFANLIQQLAEHGIDIDDYFYCPHTSLDNCDCKKPKPGMILAAAEKHGINLKDSFIVGDMASDILLRESVPMKTVLVRTGRGRYFEDIVNSDYVIDNLNGIVDII